MTGQPVPIWFNHINQSGTAVGGVTEAAGDVAVRWSALGGLTYYPSVPPVTSDAWNINARGDATVYLVSYRHIGADSLWEGNTAVWLANGQIAQLGTLGGTHTFANGISDVGLVGGHSQFGSNTGPQHAVFWDLNSPDVNARKRAQPVMSRGKTRRLP